MWDRRGAYRVLVEKSHGRRAFEKPRGRWEDNIKMNLQVKSIDLAQNRDKWRALVNAVMKLRFP